MRGLARDTVINRYHQMILLRIHPLESFETYKKKGAKCGSLEETLCDSYFNSDIFRVSVDPSAVIL